MMSGLAFRISDDVLSGIINELYLSGRVPIPSLSWKPKSSGKSTNSSWARSSRSIGMNVEIVSKPGCRTVAACQASPTPRTSTSSMPSCSALPWP